MSKARLDISLQALRTEPSDDGQDGGRKEWPQDCRSLYHWVDMKLTAGMYFTTDTDLPTNIYVTTDSSLTPPRTQTTQKAKERFRPPIATIETVGEDCLRNCPHSEWKSAKREIEHGRYATNKDNEAVDAHGRPTTAKSGMHLRRRTNSTRTFAP